MHIGFIVGIIIATTLIIIGGIAIVIDKKNNKKSKWWAIWSILFGIIALISAAINFNLFNY
jgi:RsiW-degrading membrane proteinase PrsW (M82 family)